jgi:aryl-alcohol dehydrogenase-like predicted oxidoreductase
MATKFGWKPAYEGEARWSLLDSRPEHLKKAGEGSLKRLGVETIDLYYQHRVDPKIDASSLTGSSSSSPASLWCDQGNYEEKYEKLPTKLLVFPTFSTEFHHC